MDLRAIGMGLAFVLMWSSAFTSARIAVAYASPLLLLSVRFLISGLLAMAIAGEANYLVSGDKRDVLALKKVDKTRIITARRFLTILEGEQR